MLDCCSLSKALDLISCKSRVECLEKLVVLFAIYRYMPIGRLSLSNITSVSERRIRRYIGDFRDSGLIRVDKVAGAEIVSRTILDLMSNTDIIVFENYCGVFLSCSPECLETISNRYLMFRDMIVVGMGSPFVLEVIGFVFDGGVVFPGVPEDLASKYLATAKRLLSVAKKKNCCFILVLSKRIDCCLRLVPAIYYAVDGVCRGVYRLSDVGGFCG